MHRGGCPHTDIPVRMPFPKAVRQGSVYENRRTLETGYFEYRPAAVAAE